MVTPRYYLSIIWLSYSKCRKKQILAHTHTRTRTHIHARIYEHSSRYVFLPSIKTIRCILIPVVPSNKCDASTGSKYKIEHNLTWTGCFDKCAESPSDCSTFLSLNDTMCIMTPPSIPGKIEWELSEYAYTCMEGLCNLISFIIF